MQELLIQQLLHTDCVSSNHRDNAEKWFFYLPTLGEWHREFSAFHLSKLYKLNKHSNETYSVVQYFNSVGFCIMSCKIPPESLLLPPQLCWIEQTQWNRKNSLSSFVQLHESVWPVLFKPQSRADCLRRETRCLQRQMILKRNVVSLGVKHWRGVLLLFCFILLLELKNPKNTSLSVRTTSWIFIMHYIITHICRCTGTAGGETIDIFKTTLRPKSLRKHVIRLNRWLLAD